MNDKLLKDLQDLVTQSLPEATASSLRGILEEHANQKDQIENLEASKKVLQSKLDAEVVKVDKLGASNSRISSEVSTLRIEKNEVRELAIQLSREQLEAQLRTEFANDKAKYCQDIVGQVFGNNKMKYERHLSEEKVVKGGEMTTGYTDNQGSPVMQDNGENLLPTTTTETITKEG